MRGYRLAIAGWFEYDRGPMPPRISLGWLLRIPYFVTLLGLGIRAAASSLEPAALGMDPWHQHIVLGASDARLRQHALLHHSHRAPTMHPRSAAEPANFGDQPLVVSIVDHVRAVLHTLSGSAAEALLAPSVWLPAFSVSMTLVLWAAATAAAAIAWPTPPTPPPRTSA